MVSVAKSLDLGQPDGWLKEQSEWVWSGLLQQVAQTLSQGEGLGLARVLEKELARLAEKANPADKLKSGHRVSAAHFIFKVFFKMLRRRR